MIDFRLVENDEEKIKFIEGMGDLIHQGMIPPEKLNEALANYMSTASYLHTLVETAELDYNDLKLEEEIWECEVSKEIRDRLNMDRPSSKAATAAEIKEVLIAERKDEYLKKQRELQMKERQMGFYRRLSDSWKTNSQMIINLCQNARSELLALNTTTKANEDISGEAVRRRVRIPLQD